MKTIRTALAAVMFISWAVFLVCEVLFLVQRTPPALFAASAGVTLLAVGLLCLGEAVRKNGSPAKGARSDVKVGRLQSFAFGVACCAWGVLFVGYGWLPEQCRLWAAAVFIACLALACLGGWLDGRAREREARRRGQTTPGTRAGQARIA